MMSRSKNDSRIPLSEIAELHGCGPHQVADRAARLRLEVADDWAMRPSVSIGDAAALWRSLVDERPADPHVTFGSATGERMSFAPVLDKDGRVMAAVSGPGDDDQAGEVW